MRACLVVSCRSIHVPPYVGLFCVIRLVPILGVLHLFDSSLIVRCSQRRDILGPFRDTVNSGSRSYAFGLLCAMCRQGMACRGVVHKFDDALLCLRRVTVRCA